MNPAEIIKKEYLNNPKDGIIICGPTCSGKSSAALEAAEALGGEIVSADSMQLYRFMDIGTAKPTREERQRVPHKMLDIIDPWENYNVFRYTKAAAAEIDEISRRGKVPIICGGTGLYVNSLIDMRNYGEDEGESEEISVISGDGEALYSELKAVDPEAAALTHPNNEKRVKRFLELYYKTGLVKAERDRRSLANPPVKHYNVFCLLPERERLYEKINLRVDIMREQGLFEECKRVYNMCRENFSGPAEEIETLTAMLAIGYRELIPIVKNQSDEIKDGKSGEIINSQSGEIINGQSGEIINSQSGEIIDSAFDLIKQDTRRYAKRQFTWFKRTPGAAYITEEGLCTTIR